MDLQDVEESLLNVIDAFVGQLPAEQLTDMAHLARAGEQGIAFENLCTQLYEHDLSLSRETIGILRTIGTTMGVDSKYCGGLEAIESAPTIAIREDRDQTTHVVERGQK
jgi:hypothetical protein